MASYADALVFISDAWADSFDDYKFRFTILSKEMSSNVSNCRGISYIRIAFFRRQRFLHLWRTYLLKFTFCLDSRATKERSASVQLTQIHFHSGGLSVPKTSVLLCMCIHSGTSLCSACSHVTSAWYGQTWSVYLFHYPDRSFLIVRKQLHTFTKLTLQSSFFESLLLHLSFFFQFHFPPLVSIFFH